MKLKILFISFCLLLLSFSNASEEPHEENIKDSKVALEKIVEHLKSQSTESIPTLTAENTATSKSEDSDEKPSDIKSITPQDQATHSYEKAFIKMIFILIAILAVVFIIFYLFKRFSSSRMALSNHSRSIKILEKRAISPKSMLYLIEIGGQKILLAESQLEIRNVSNLEWLENNKQGL